MTATMRRTDPPARLTHKERQELILTRPDINPEALLDDYEVASLLNCSVQALRIGRVAGRVKGKAVNLPPHRVIFQGLIRYRYGDVITWAQPRQEETT